MKNGKLMVAPAMLWLSIFFVIPLLIVVAVSFAGRTPYGQIIFEFTLKKLSALFRTFIFADFCRHSDSSGYYYRCYHHHGLPAGIFHCTPA